MENKLTRNMNRTIDYFRALIRIPRVTKQEDDIDFIFSNKYINILQIKSEFFNLLDLIKEKKPKVMMEIGTLKGGSLFFFSRSIAKNAFIISLDSFPDLKNKNLKKYMTIKLLKKIPLKNQKFHLITNDSHSENAIRKVKYLLEDKIDFLFIDGDHSYEGVKKDFEIYSPLVKEGGIIAFHDIKQFMSRKDPNSNVGKFWGEIKNKYKHMEFVENKNQIDFGIGVIIKNKLKK